MLNRIVKSFDASLCIALLLSLAHMIQEHIGILILEIEFTVLEFH